MQVVLYTGSACSGCQAAKALLERRKIPYREVRIDVDPRYAQELVEKTGSLTLPVAEILRGERREFLIGWDPRRWAKAFELEDFSC